MVTMIDDFKEEEKVSTSSPFWDYKNMPTLIGAVVKINPEGHYGYDVDVSYDDKDSTLRLPNLVALEDFFKSLQVGDKVKLVYEGEKKSASGRTYASFQLYRRRTS